MRRLVLAVSSFSFGLNATGMALVASMRLRRRQRTWQGILSRLRRRVLCRTTKASDGRDLSPPESVGRVALPRKAAVDACHVGIAAAAPRIDCLTTAC